MDDILLYGIVWVGLFALMEILWGFLTVTYGLIVHRSELDLNPFRILLIYVALLNPFTTRDTSTRVNSYLENL